MNLIVCKSASVNRITTKYGNYIHPYEDLTGITGLANNGMWLKPDIVVMKLEQQRLSCYRLPSSGITLLLCVWGLSSVGQRAEKGLSLQQCWEIPQKNTTTTLNHGAANDNNRHRGRTVMLADGKGTDCKQHARIKIWPWLIKTSEKGEKRFTIKNSYEEVSEWED